MEERGSSRRDESGLLWLFQQSRRQVLAAREDLAVVKIALSSGAAALLQPRGRKQGRKGAFPLLSYLHGAGGDVF